LAAVADVDFFFLLVVVLLVTGPTTEPWQLLDLTLVFEEGIVAQVDYYSPLSAYTRNLCMEWVSESVPSIQNNYLNQKTDDGDVDAVLKNN
jgi:hypothetical protein